MRLDYSKNDFDGIKHGSLIFSFANPYQVINSKYRIVGIDLYKHHSVFCELDNEGIEALNCLMIAYAKKIEMFKECLGEVIENNPKAASYINHLANKYTMIGLVRESFPSLASYIVSVIISELEEVKSRLLDELRNDYTFVDCVNGIAYFGINKYSGRNIFTKDWGKYTIITDNIWR